MKNRDKVVLVDDQDAPIGQMDKLEAHQKGALHRAFSIFLFNSNGEMLLQQRAKEKYHGGGLWTNACCSHPQWDEDILESALERLEFEMGIRCDIQEAFTFSYKTAVENDLIEHEVDHVFIGHTDIDPKPNREEVQDFKWMNINHLLKDAQQNHGNYTYWFKMALPAISDFYEKQIN